MGKRKKKHNKYNLNKISVDKSKKQLVESFKQIVKETNARRLMQYLETEGIKNASHWRTITFVLPEHFSICVIELLKIGIDRDGSPAPNYTYKVLSLEENAIHDIDAYCDDKRIFTKELGITNENRRIKYKEVEDVILDKIVDDPPPFNFGDLPVAYYNAIYKDGKLFNTKTGKEIQLKEGAPIRLKTLHSHVLDEDYEKHLEKRRETMLNKGTVLIFKINKYCFHLELKEPLFLTKEGNKNSRLSNVHCQVTAMYKGDKHIPEFEYIEANSLSQAYTQTSINHFPDNGSHNRNTFLTFYFDKKPLKEYRMF